MANWTLAVPVLCGIGLAVLRYFDAQRERRALRQARADTSQRLMPDYAAYEKAACRDYKARNRAAMRAYDKRYNETHKGKCPQCGGETGRQTAGICQNCHAARVAARTARLEALWAEGRTLKEIAQEFGWSSGHLQQEMHRARERGAHLPYRYRLPHPVFPDQVAA